MLPKNLKWSVSLEKGFERATFKYWLLKLQYSTKWLKYNTVALFISSIEFFPPFIFIYQQEFFWKQGLLYVTGYDFQSFNFRRQENRSWCYSCIFGKIVKSAFAIINLTFWNVWRLHSDISVPRDGEMKAEVQSQYILFDWIYLYQLIELFRSVS